MKPRTFQEAPDLRTQRLLRRQEQREKAQAQTKEQKEQESRSKPKTQNSESNQFESKPIVDNNDAGSNNSSSSNNRRNNSNSNSNRPPRMYVKYKGKDIEIFRSKQGMCIACIKRDKLVNISRQCTHEPQYCIDCIAKTMGAEVSQKGTSRFGCKATRCRVQFEYSQFYHLLSVRDLRIVDKLMTNRCLEKMPEFRWCKNSRGCGNGQLVSNWQDLLGYYTCHSCETALCFQHEIEWHNGFTCEEYQKELNKNNRFGSEQVLLSFTKTCPNEKCKARIAKLEGCDVMCCCQYGTHGCKENGKLYKNGCDHGGKQYCGQLFCWKCLGKIETTLLPNGRYSAYKRHCKPTCEYADLN